VSRQRRHVFPDFTLNVTKQTQVRLMIKVPFALHPRISGNRCLNRQRGQNGALEAKLLLSCASRRPTVYREIFQLSVD
jgi:hypothetical protein